MTARPYNSQCLLSNWYEDRELQDFADRNFRQLKNNNKLLTQSWSKITNQLLQDKSPSIITDGLKHNQKVCLSAKNNGSTVAIGINQSEWVLNCQYVSDATNNKKIDIEPMDEIDVTGCKYISEDSIRNSRFIFNIESVDADETIQYGKSIMISVEFNDIKYYLASEKSFVKCASISRNNSVYLTKNLNYRCHWMFMYGFPEYQFEMMHKPVKCDMLNFIINRHTNENLNIEDALHYTIFGNEYEISTKNVKGSKSNLWKFSASC
ncbi:hypothetical protein A3Q56_03602, partial [Intoshia linei]